ncbi:hypothetical protein predicted by Glimmer/Critica [Acetobacter ghanensis]|uniref:Uncharacterized protein n=1 Tax=Acetobacter ghanensis TaxID=431306 RepID=A0A0U5F2L9_9PROT|nr:hypothetical protein predicted by Glimmer/Critica [Acetobacter ghanensis]
MRGGSFGPVCFFASANRLARLAIGQGWQVWLHGAGLAGPFH